MVKRWAINDIYQRIQRVQAFLKAMIGLPVFSFLLFTDRSHTVTLANCVEFELPATYLANEARAVRTVSQVVPVLLVLMFHSMEAYPFPQKQPPETNSEGVAATGLQSF